MRQQVNGGVATPEQTATENEWLTLDQASRRLGVHPTTLRRWANQGAIDVLLTPGGHRRFHRADLERFQRERRRTGLPVPPDQGWASHAIAQARRGLQGQRWLAVYDDSEREVKRRLGRRLMGLVFQYIARPDEGRDLLLEARIIGEEHGRGGMRLGQPLGDLLQAVSFFRTTLLEVALLEQPQSIAAQPEASLWLLRRLGGLLDEVQAGVVEAYTGGVQPGCA